MMNRRLINCLLTVLLTLLPAALSAQTLSHWEYWFDDDKDNKTGFAFSGTERDISTDIATDGLAPGVHQLHIRVARSGGEYNYSPVSTTTFFKRPTGSGRQMEYWFDGDYKNRQAYAMDAEGEAEELTLNMASLSPGLHQVSMRVASPGQAYSAVYSAVVLKVGSGNVDKLEYWIDDDYAGKKTISMVSGNDVTAHFVSDLDLSYLPMGVYRLNYRVFSSTGNAASAVGSAAVIVKTGATPVIEYWIDDDYEHAKTLEGTAMTGGFHFSKDVDFSTVSPGAHRLNYRAFMTDGKVKGAISSTPFIANSRYDGDGSDAVVTGYSVWVDNDERMFIPSITPEAEKNFGYTVDGRKLSTGEHTLHTKVWNSYGLSHEECDVFSVVEPTAPNLVLQAESVKGLVKLRVNPIANDISYHVFRINEDGAYARVYSTKQSYPTDVTFIDHPGAGSYKYYILGIYTDADGNILSVKSNEVGTAVTSELPVVTTKYGTINGRLTTDTHTPQSGVKVVFSDQVAVRVVNGLFRRENVPCGSLTLTVQGDDAHEYDAKVIDVKEGPNQVTLTGRLIESPTENNLTNDLAFASSLSWEPAQYLKFKVKNLTGKYWKGRLRVRIVRKNEKAEVDISGDAQAGAGSVASLNKEKNYDVITTDELEVYGSPLEVEIPLTEFKPRLTDWYDFYVESLKSEEGPLKLNPPYKMVARNADIENPICRKLEKIDSDDLTEEEEAEMVANWIVYLCGKVKDLDGKLAKLGKLENDIARITGSQLAGTKTYEELEKRIDDLIKSGRVKQDKDMKTLSEKIAMHISDAAAMDYVAIKKFRDNVSTAVKVAKDISKFWGYVKNAVGAVNEYQKIHGMDGYEKFFYCSKKVLELSKDPFTEILKNYIDIGEKIVNYALGIAMNEYAPWIPARISDYVPEREDVERNPEMYAYNKHINFKIVINYKSGIFPYWNESMSFAKHTDPKELIEKVLVKVQNDKDPATATFDLIGVSDGIMLKQTSFDNGGVRYNDGGTRGYLENMKAPTRFWMEIYWKNGRVSKLPLLNTDGINFHISTNTPSLITINFFSHSVHGARAYKNIADIIELTK